jgi:hypothetical protein
LRPLPLKEFQRQALAVIERLTARIKNPQPDLIAGIKNCLAELDGLAQRGVVS